MSGTPTTALMFIYRFGWDTRCRIVAAANVLRPLLQQIVDKNGEVLLDVGCGSPGVALLLPEYKIVGLDIHPPIVPLPNVRFLESSCEKLPFADQSFPVVSSIDVLEHLPLTVRAASVREMVRVAKSAVMIACPFGETAKSCDEKYRRQVEASGIASQDWLQEHQAQEYPQQQEVVDLVKAAAEASGRKVEFQFDYCEPANVCSFVRSSAAVSKYVYALTNLAVGLLHGFIPKPNEKNAYRMIISAKFV